MRSIAHYIKLRSYFAWTSILMVICCVSGMAHFQERSPERNSMRSLSDKQLVEAIASTDQELATLAVQEAMRRGESVIPLLIKHKGDRRFYFGHRLGKYLPSMFKLDWPERKSVDDDVDDVETVEAASLYLISAIFYNKFDFAYSAFLEDLSLPAGYRRVHNSRDLLAKAWTSVERWENDRKEVGLKTLRSKNRAPLAYSGLRFH